MGMIDHIAFINVVGRTLSLKNIVVLIWIMEYGESQFCVLQPNFECTYLTFPIQWVGANKQACMLERCIHLAAKNVGKSNWKLF